MGLDLGPVFLPATTAFHVAKGQHWVDMLFGPMHPGAFQPYFYHQFVAAFHDSAGDWPAICLKTGLLNLLLPFFEIGQVAGNCLCVGMLSLQLIQLGE